MVGFLVGFFGEYLFSFLLNKSSFYILETIFTEKQFLIFISKFPPLNVIIFVYLCDYILSILIIFISWHYWRKYLKSRNMGVPKLTTADTTNPKITIIPIIQFHSLMVYLSFWGFIGILIGIDIAMFLAVLGMMIEFEVIPLSFSFSWDTFQVIYTNLTTKFPYFEYYAIVYFAVAVSSLSYIVIIYEAITWSSNEVKRKITAFFKYGFPEIKITTENSEVKGQLTEIINKKLVTVGERDMLKMIPWDKIETMEASRKDKNSEFKIN